MSEINPERRLAASLITGFLTPVYSEEIRLPDGSIRHNHGLTRADFDRVMTGYACGECLATTDTYTETCPACGLARQDVANAQQTPELWQQAFNERNNDTTPYATPRSFDDFMADVLSDGDVERIQLSDLRPSRPGARRS